jgi:hypothetical protein
LSMFCTLQIIKIKTPVVDSLVFGRTKECRPE